MKYKLLVLALAAATFVSLASQALPASAQVQNPQGGSIGIEGVIPGDAPETPATITVPSNGQSFSTLPVTVSGICPVDTIVKIYRNNVFSGSVLCSPGGSYTIQIDLFEGRNELIARVYDALDQAGPDSNTVVVNYVSTKPDDGIEDLLLTSNFSNRGANPGTELKWPLVLTGGVGPYAFSIDWGDGTIEPLSLEQVGQFNITHVYKEPGVYKLIIKATDSRGDTAFLQLTAVANGTVDQTLTESSGGSGAVTADGQPADSGIDTGQLRIRYVLWPIYVMMFLVVTTFWLGKKYEKRRIRQKLYYSRDGLDL